MPLRCAVSDILFHVFVGLRATSEEICRSGREDSEAHDTMIQHTMISVFNQP